MSSSSSELEGYLKKLGVKGPRNSYKKRLFKMRGSRIYYYAPKSLSQEKGFIELEEAISVSRTDPKKFAFQINTPQRIYHLKADSEDAMNYWINGIKQLLMKVQQMGMDTSVADATLKRELETTKNRISDLERQNAQLNRALELAARELSITVGEIIKTADEGSRLQKNTSSLSLSSGSSSAAPVSGSSSVQPITVVEAPVVDRSDSEGESDSDDDTASATTTSSADHFGAQVLYEYSARKHYELSVKVNEIITVLSKHENGWWLGCNREGKQGYFPGSYVRPLNQT
eukprot:TRINITY_DN13678_c0_g1_i1.p1 TRINITY_DN13678_c0_g1~~TRINITY_DN13678_c0_g1_i1.p1  ORF type:complete len:287 (+),score=127.23 TRINITY_DN13678_c0_g1_i1:30-890(+)